MGRTEAIATPLVSIDELGPCFSIRLGQSEFFLEPRNLILDGFEGGRGLRTGRRRAELNGGGALPGRGGHGPGGTTRLVHVPRSNRCPPARIFRRR